MLDSLARRLVRLERNPTFGAVSYQIEKVSELERVKRKIRVPRDEMRVVRVLTPKKELLDISG